MQRLAPPAETEKLLTVEELAALLQLSKEWVLDQVSAGVIPVIRFNARTFRYHWPSVLAALQKLS